jgi:hypothetical protein
MRGTPDGPHTLFQSFFSDALCFPNELVLVELGGHWTLPFEWLGQIPTMEIIRKLAGPNAKVQPHAAPTQLR